jgi:hypothetical protein
MPDMGTTREQCVERARKHGDRVRVHDIERAIAGQRLKLTKRKPSSDERPEQTAYAQTLSLYFAYLTDLHASASLAK